jgi:N-acetylglucosaminyl-diphospho-decaprenol L-rhamnosyltransferase
LDLSIIVVTHESACALPGLLASLDPDERRRIRAVDNASTDQTRALLAEAGIATIALAENRGFARAANVGARGADGRWLCFLNPDARPSPALFAAGLRAVSARAVACAAPRLREPDRTIEGRQAGYTRWKLVCDLVETRWSRTLAAMLRRAPGHDDPRWHWPHGGCFFVERETFLRLGGFDERFFLYMEDVDFGRRFAAAGGRVVTIDETVEHGSGRSSAVTAARHRALLDGGRIRYGEIHYGRHFARLLAAIAPPPARLRARFGRAEGRRGS